MTIIPGDMIIWESGAKWLVVSVIPGQIHLVSILGSAWMNLPRISFSTMSPREYTYYVAQAKLHGEP